LDASDLPPSGATASPPPVSLFDSLPDALLRLDRASRVVYVNPAFERATALARRAVLGRRLDQVAGFEPYAALWQEQLDQLLESEEERWFKFGYEHPLGRRHFDVRLFLERAPEPAHVTALLRDVSYTRGAVRASRGADALASALHGALEQAGEMVIEVGTDGTVLDANETAMRQLGLQRADFGATALTQIDRDLTAAEFAALLDRLRLHGAERRQTHYAHQQRGGAAVPVEVIAQRASNGSRESVFLLARDIGERRRAELALLESAERFRSLFDESPVALLMLDENLRVLQANRSASRLLDRALVDLVGLEVASLLHPVDPAAADRLRRDLAAETLPEPDADVRIVHADGQTLWARLVVRGWRAQRLRRYLLVLEDYTERKLAALQLESAVAQQRTLLESMAAAVAHVRDGAIVMANGEFSRLFGYPEQAVAGMALARLTEGEAAGDSAPGPLPPVEPGRTSSAETMLLTVSGRPLWCLVQARALAAEPAAPKQAIYTFQDITAQRESREALARSLLELNLVFDATEVALLHLADGRVIRCNAQAAAMFGGPDGPVGRAFTALTEWSAEDPLPAWLEAGGLAGAPPAEVRMRGADGTPFWALVSMRAIDPQRPGAGQIVSVLNIDARKRSEQEVQRMRNYLDLVVESLPVSLAVRDARDGRFVSINRAGEALFGRPREAVIGRTWPQLYPREFADELAALDARVLEGGQLVEQPRATSRAADGRTLTVHRRVLPVFESGEPAPRYLMSIVDDLTEAVRTEAALQDTEAHFRELAEHIDAFVFIADRTLTVLTYASPRSEALLGIPAARLQADPRLALERVQAQQRPVLARRLPLLLARLARLRRVELTVRIDHPTRGPRSLAVRLTPVRTPEGGLRIFGMVEDATEREALQDQRLDKALKTHEMLMHELRQRLRKNLLGVAGLMMQQAYARPELGEPLTDSAAQIQAIAVVHGIAASDDAVPLTALVQGIFSSLAGVYNAIVQVEPPGTPMARWRIAESEAVPMAMVISELGSNAIKHRGKDDQRVVARMSARGERFELRIEQPGRLKEGFDLARVSPGVSGLGLAKALLPHRGTRLRIEQLGPLVITRLELTPPAVRQLAAPAP